jgi:ABC-type multidrug transport system fused ATPase/permease subunit
MAAKEPFVEGAPNYTNRQFLSDLWRFIRPYRARFWVATALRAIGDLTNLWPAYALAVLVTFFTTWQPGEPLTFPWIIIAIWFASSFVYSGSHHGAKYLGYTLAERAGTDALSAGVKQLGELDASWHEKEGSGTKIKRVQRGRDAVIKSLRVWYSNVIEIVINFIGTSLIITQTDWFTGALYGGLIISYTGIAYLFTRKTVNAAHREGIEEEKVQNVAFDLVSNIRTVRVLDIARHLFTRFTAAVQTLFDRIHERVFAFQSQGVTLSLWYGLYKIGVFAFIVYGISKGQLEVGFLILFNGYSVKVRESAQEIVEVTQEYLVAKNSLSRLHETLEAPVRSGLSAPAAFPTDWSAITVNNLEFAYEASNPVLRGISFSVKRGERIGIVGSSGAGKSTIFKLLLKEYDNFKGDILINDVPIQQVNERSYFDKVAVVLQDTEVFNLSLRENIVTARPNVEVDPKLFEHADAVSYVKDFVHKLPSGYETVIGERGFKLSVGERQRVGIARAILKQPDILLLDEATSHLDLESEEKIRASLHTVFQGMTAIVIAHRLTTIKEMDRILVIEDGKIVEEGSFNALHKKKGRFYDLWEKQRL